jgi:hypothetical protein
MTDQELRQELQELHDQIEASLHKSPSDKDLLGHIMTDVVRLAQGEEIGEVDAESLKEQLEDKATDFESRHPTIAGVLRDMMDVLARLGI